MKKILFLFICAAAMCIAGCAPKATVETREATGITTNDAVLHGYVGDYEEMPRNVGILFGTSEDGMEKIIRDEHPNGLLQAPELVLSYDLSIDADKTLEPETTYYYRFFAWVSGKEVYGETKSFTTVATVPEADLTVETEDAVEITAHSARIYERIYDFETKPDEAGIYIGTSEGELKKAARMSDPMKNYDTSDFETWFDTDLDAEMTLEPSTTYYYQCYAKIGDAETRGEIKSFTTLAQDPATEAPATEAPAADVTAQ